MGEDASQDISGLLRAYSRGERGALDALIPLVEGELRQIARRYLRRRRDQGTLQTTELLDETFLRLIRRGQADWQDRLHFLALCAHIMRAILVDHARSCCSARRGAGARPLPLLENDVPAPQPDSDLEAIDEALHALSQVDPRKGRVVELRFFGGLTIDETAEVLGVSANTVKRDWLLAKLWLLREMGGAQGRPS